VKDPRAAYSYRHPGSGEWAHPLHAGPLADAASTYVLPALEILAPRFARAAAPNCRALVIGFGRGFEAAALLRALGSAQPLPHLALTGLEPHPEWLEPWPPRWPGLSAEEAPWWGCGAGRWSGPGWEVEVVAESAATWLARAPTRRVDLILMDLFSPAHAPEDWEPGLFPGLARVAAPGAVLTTYTCARRVREGLAAAGWNVQILRGGGARDTLRASWSEQAPP